MTRECGHADAVECDRAERGSLSASGASPTPQCVSLRRETFPWVGGWDRELHGVRETFT